MFTATPHTLDLDLDRPEEQAHAWQYEVAIKNVSDEGFSLTMVAAPAGESIGIELPGGTIRPGSSKTITVTIDPAVAEQLFTRSFTVEASDEAKTRYTLPIQKKMRWGPTPMSAR